MKKQMLILISSLILSNDTNASEAVRGEHCYRPAFQKKLKRVKPVKMGSFRSLGLKKRGSKKEIFIDWRKLYWGKLDDLIYSEEEAYLNDVQEIGETEEQNVSSLNTEETQAFVKELRQELKAFARQYGLKILWRKKSVGLVDGTAAFLEYWDKGLSQEESNKLIPFADLCALSVSDTSIKDTSIKDTSIKDTSIRDTSIRDTSVAAATAKNASVRATENTKKTKAKATIAPNVALENASFSNLLFKKGA